MNSKRPIEMAPKGGGAERVTDPLWVEPPSILLFFDENKASIGHWDWYYADGGNGCTDGIAWVDDLTGERLVNHYGQPTHWMNLEDIETAIPRATVAAALAELREKFKTQDSAARSYENGWNDALHFAITTIAKLGLEAQ